ncbi:MAG: acryloyl-CoA reductase [Alphaproteobacteria bacterium]|nr:acryloyl-CoA reductase [Alphaproteobacteria bacterium]
MFRALLLDRPDGKFEAKIVTLDDSALPEGDVTVAVSYSSLNYKDGLAIADKGKIVRSFPMVPGVDWAGTVESSASPAFKPGDKVLLTGWGVGETYWGGMAEKARAKAEWLLKLPPGTDEKWAMTMGTAGLTAMMSVHALEANGVRREKEVLVTGAAGGVGTVAVALLAKLGHKVVASTGRKELEPYLKKLGAHTVIDRAELSKMPRPLESERWAGAIDTVGSTILANVLASTARRGTVVVCGLAAGPDLPTTVMPFILRGVRLIGIDSSQCPLPERDERWRKLAALLPDGLPGEAVEMCGLGDLPKLAEAIVAGKVRGRTIVDVRK